MQECIWGWAQILNLLTHLESPVDLLEHENSPHPTGFSLFGSVGVVAVEMRGGADATIVIMPDATRVGLSLDFCGEVDFVVRRADAGTELDNEIFRIGVKCVAQARDGCGDDVAFGAATSRVGQGNDLARRIVKVDRAAIGDADDERHPRNGRGHGVDVRNANAERGVDDLDAIAVRLLGMDGVQHGETGGNVGGVDFGVDLQWHTAAGGKAVAQTAELKGRECFQFHGHS